MLSHSGYQRTEKFLPIINILFQFVHCVRTRGRNSQYLEDLTKSAIGEMSSTKFRRVQLTVEQRDLSVAFVRTSHQQ